MDHWPVLLGFQPGGLGWKSLQPVASVIDPHGLERQTRTMSTLAEIEEAAEALPPKDPAVSVKELLATSAPFSLYYQLPDWDRTKASSPFRRRLMVNFTADGKLF